MNNFGVVSPQQIGVDHTVIECGQVWANRSHSIHSVKPMVNTFAPANLWVITYFTGRNVELQNPVNGKVIGVPTGCLRDKFTFVY